MCFGSSSKDKDGEGPPVAARPAAAASGSAHPAREQQPQPQLQPQPQPQQQQQGKDNDMSHGEEHYAPPPGPPPPPVPSSSTRPDFYEAPPGPPPQQRRQQQEEYAPPPGPPPGRSEQQQQDAQGGDGNADAYYAPPPGPPPTYEGKKPQHDWESVVPDTSLFPPPPDIFSGWDRSPANNASEVEAQAGSEWCSRYPLAPPATLDAEASGALEFHNIRLITPPRFAGSLDWDEKGRVWRGKTKRGAQDTSIVGYPPLYSVKKHSPLLPSATTRTTTCYYEVRILSDSRKEETSLALGFAALPYPTFRLPGWHRGSLAIHGDDGHKYINDMWGGRSFAQPIKRDQTVGIGMRFSNGGDKRNITVEVFFTRDGRLDGKWDLHEETDAEQELPVTGLEGYHDLSCVIGSFDKVSFEVVFEPALWKYRGEEVRGL